MVALLVLALERALPSFLAKLIQLSNRRRQQQELALVTQRLGTHKE
jgi:hypothetical protein